MLQSRQLHIFQDKENDVQQHTRPSKTPGPARKISREAGDKVWPKTTGLRGTARVLKKSDGKSSEQDSGFMQPQKLVFKGNAVPQTAKKPQGLLGDKTNAAKATSHQTTSKVPGSASKAPTKSSLLKTPGAKKHVRLVPMTPAAPPKLADDEAFRTPAPHKRAQRPPPIEASPDAFLDSGDCIAQEVTGPNFQDVQVPDVEYGPPTAYVEPPLEPDEALDFHSLGPLLNSGMPYFIHDDVDTDVALEILNEAKDTVWLPESPVSLELVSEEEFKACLVPLPHSTRPSQRVNAITNPNTSLVNRRLENSKRPLNSTNPVATRKLATLPAKKSVNGVTSRTTQPTEQRRTTTKSTTVKSKPMISQHQPVKSSSALKRQQEREEARNKADEELKEFNNLTFSTKLHDLDESFRIEL